jgi:hypothetical protein
MPASTYDLLRRLTAQTTHEIRAAPISLTLSSWMKWMPFTVSSVWFGHVRQNSRSLPLSRAPGS